jgi:hypothetical protein
MAMTRFGDSNVGFIEEAPDGAVDGWALAQQWACHRTRLKSSAKGAVVPAQGVRCLPGSPGPSRFLDTRIAASIQSEN